MPVSPVPSVMNNFTGGLKTEYTGLNFPLNACTDMLNTVPEIQGDNTRRLGIDYELNYSLQGITSASQAISMYKWDNAGGDGNTQLIVYQVGTILYFYKSSAATTASPISTTKIANTVDLIPYLSGTNPSSSLFQTECQYTDGNGYLFVFNPFMEPIYCTYNVATNTVSAIEIDVQTRDFAGVSDNIPDTYRPTSLTNEHNYNLQNQGWTQNPSWAVSSHTFAFTGSFPGTHGLGLQGFTVFGTPNGTPQVGDTCLLVAGKTNVYAGVSYEGFVLLGGNVTAYDGVTLTVFVTDYDVNTPAFFQSCSDWVIFSSRSGYVDGWHTTFANYPSNSDVWWRYRDDTNTFNPGSVINKVTQNFGDAPKGHFILNAFNQDRTFASGVTSITPVTTSARPKTGAWYAGRVFYAGVDASQPPKGDATFYAWTENIYFSQIIETMDQVGKCYQADDPTNSDLFDLLSSDGGVIVIQGSGTVYKLFPIQNGLLVFAANGIWFITGSQGIGFAANDYTITKISSIQSISSSSFVNVMGLPYFWNEEGIYTVVPAQQGLGLQVEPITVGTILRFYSEIPPVSKRYAKAAYDPINYELKFIYKTATETDITSRYQYDGILNFNVFTKAFYPYQVTGTPSIHGILYVTYPATSTTPDPSIKYLASGSNNFTFAEERDTSYVDWKSFDGVGTNYSSFFITGYDLKGKALFNFMTPYIYVYSRQDTDTAYRIQSVWDFTSTPDSGRWSIEQWIYNNLSANMAMGIRRIRLRGSGQAVQLKFQSVDGQPFDIMGWSIWAIQNQGM